MKEFFNLLFDSGEGFCTGDAFANQVLKYPKEGEFFCVNPLDLYRDYGHMGKEEYSEFVPRRADINVSCFRNFMFEMDGMPLDDQLKIFRNSEIPFTTITFSGSKSYHAILSVDPFGASDPHTQMGIDSYKLNWKRLAARINKEAIKLGYKYSPGQFSFVDQSCQNPSRLTRYPEMVRSNGEVQQLVQLTERMPQSEFLALLSECPMIVSTSRKSFDAPENEIDTIEDFSAIASPNLLRKLQIVDWAGPENMYRELYKLSLWAIDETNVTYNTFVNVLEKYTFKSLLNAGYPPHKLTVGVEHAFREKNRI